MVNYTINGTKVYFNPKTHRQARGTIVNGYYYDKEIMHHMQSLSNQFIDMGMMVCTSIFDSEWQASNWEANDRWEGVLFQRNGSAGRGDFDYFGTGTYYDKKTGL